MDAVEQIGTRTETDIDAERLRLRVQRDIHDARMRDDKQYALSFRADYLTARCKRTVPSKVLMEAVEQGRAWERREKIKQLKVDRDRLRGTQSVTSEEKQ